MNGRDIDVVFTFVAVVDDRQFISRARGLSFN